MTSYLVEVTAPKTPKVKFVNPSTSSTPTGVLRPVPVKEVKSLQIPAKSKRIFLPRSYNQNELTLEGVKSQVYSGPITRSRAKALTYAEVTLHSLVTTLDQGQDQLKEQDKYTSPVFYDLKNLFQKRSRSPAIIPQGQITRDD